MLSNLGFIIVVFPFFGKISLVSKVGPIFSSVGRAHNDKWAVTWFESLKSNSKELTTQLLILLNELIINGARLLVSGLLTLISILVRLLIIFRRYRNDHLLLQVRMHHYILIWVYFKTFFHWLLDLVMIGLNMRCL